MSDAITPTLSKDLEVKVGGALATAQAIVVDSEESYQSAAAWRGTAKDLLKSIKEFFKPMKKAADDAHKAIVNKENTTIADIEKAVTIVGMKMRDWYDEQERLKAAREAELQEKARKLEEERRLNDAKKLEAQGKKTEALASLNAPISVPTVKLDSPEAEGVVYVDHWVARCTDLKATVQFIVTSGRWDLLNLLMHNTAAANTLAAATKAASAIPGIEFVNEKVMRQRTKGR